MPRSSGGESLKVARGQRVLAEHHNGLVHLAEQITIGRGRLKGRQDSGGFVARLDIKAVAAVSHAWKAALDEEEDLWLRFLVPSHVSGIVPEIDGIAIDDVQEDGEPPRLKIPEAAFARRGRSERALVMLRYELRAEDFRVEKVVPVAVPAPPAFAPFRWHKLLGWITRQEGAVKWWPQMFFPAAFDASGTDKKTGRFKPWPRIA